MKLLMISHKPCWTSATDGKRYATDGGFPFQVSALSELFDETRLCVPCSDQSNASGEVLLTGHNLTVVPLSPPRGHGFWRKLAFPFWLARSGVVVFNETRHADAVHAPIPGDVGTIGMLLSYLLRKPLFVRHCGNWFVQTTAAEHFWKWFMVKFAGGRNVMLATGGASESPSSHNPNLRWVFSSTLTEKELRSIASRSKQSDRHPRLIIVCRQEEKKGTEVVIESLPLIVEKFPHTTLDVVGDGSELMKFKELAKKLGISERITFHGKVNHEAVSNLLKQADLFCYPTTASEGFPKVVLEALAQGLPVVTTKVSVLPQLIGETGSGMLIDEAAPAAMARAVNEILADADRYHEMSEQAMKTAKQYSLERWRDTIGTMLKAAWGGPLRSDV